MQCIGQSTVQCTVQPTEQCTVQCTVQSNDIYVYGVDVLAVLVIGACVFFAYPKNKKQDNDHHHNRKQPPKRCHML